MGLALVVLGALLACKKATPAEETPSASSVAEPPPTPEATVSAAEDTSAAPTEVDSAAPAPVPTKVTVVTKKDAGTVLDAGAAKDAGPPPNTAADYKKTQACCNALSGEAKKGGLNANRYTSAAAVCNGIAQRVKNGSANAAAAKTLIRAQLQGIPVPGSC